jgi:endonuclease/exonuclease/phosphatase family metal-dependent hydrolase
MGMSAKGWLAASLLLLNACSLPISAPALSSSLVRRLDVAVDPALPAVDPSAPAGAPLAAPSSLTVAMYNLRNLNDNPLVAPDGTVTKPKPLKDRIGLANSIKTINADVIVVAEVESLAVLKTFRDTYLADQGFHNVVLVEGNDVRGIDVGVLSRVPLTSVKTHKDVTFPVPGVAEPQKFCRDLLQVGLRTRNGYAFTVFAAHLKSHYGGGNSDTLRLAEAQTVKRIIGDYERANPKANYILCGDMNDQPETVVAKTLVGANDPTTRLTDTLMELGPQAYTYWIPKYRGRIDYLLASPGMMGEYVKGSAKIFKNTDAFNGSDHLPSTVRFDTTVDR